LDCDEEVYSWDFTGNEKKCLGMCALSCFWNLKHILNFLPVELGVFSIRNTNNHYVFWIHCFKNSSSAWSRMRGGGVHGLYRSPGNTSLTRCRLLSLCVYPFLPFTALNKLMDPER